MNRLLQQTTVLLNRTGSVAKPGRSGGGLTPAGTDPKIIQEQTQQLTRQVNAVKRKNQALGESLAVINKLSEAEDAINAGTAEGIRLGRLKLAGAKALVAEKEQEIRAADQLAEAERRASREANNRRRSMREGAGRAAGRAAGAVNSAFGGVPGAALRGLGNAAIRGGTAAFGIGAASLAGGALSTQWPTIMGHGGGLVVPQMEGIAGAVQSLVMHLSSMPGALGAAAVAAAAFAPWLPKVAGGLAAVGQVAKGIAESPAVQRIGYSGSGVDMPLKAAAIGTSSDVFRNKLGTALADAGVAALDAAMAQATREIRAHEGELSRRARSAATTSSSTLSNLTRMGASVAPPAPRTFPTNNYGRQAFPAGNTMTAQPQYREMLNSQASTAALKAESKTAEVRWSWLQALRQGRRLQEEITSGVHREAAAQERVDRVIKRIRQSKRQERVQQLQEQKRQAEGRGESIALGVGFPLMFGAGPASIAGSLVGSFVGKGFGGQIFGGAIGQRLDDMTNAAAELGRSLKDPIANFEDLADKGLFATGAQRKYIEALIESGRVAEANALIQKEVIAKVGVQGRNDLLRLGEASTRLSSNWAELNIQMQAALSGPMADLLAWINNIVAAEVDSNRKNASTRDFMTALRAQNPAAVSSYLNESRALAEANGGKVNDAAVMKLREKYLPNGVPSAGGQLTAEQQALEKARGKSLEIAKAELTIAQLGGELVKDAVYDHEKKLIVLKFQKEEQEKLAEGLTDETLELRKQTALRELENRRNKELAQLAKQAADDARKAVREQLQAEQALLQSRLDFVGIQGRQADAFKGPISGSADRLEMLHSQYTLNSFILKVQLDQARAEESYAANAQQVEQTFKNRYNLLTLEYDLNKKLETQAYNRAKIENEITRNQRKLGYDAELAGLVFTGGMTAMQQLQESQSQRRRGLLEPKLQEIEDLKLKLAAPEGTFSTDQIALYKQELIDVNDQVGKLVSSLDRLDNEETVWQKGQAEMQMYESAAASLVSSISQGFDLLVAGTEELGTALQSLASQLLATVGKMLIFYAIGSALKALAGGAADDKGGILTFLAGAFGQRASGGPVEPGGTYLVGEQGPELLSLRPDGGGYVYNNQQTTSAMSRYAPGRGANGTVSGTSSSSADAGGSMTVDYTGPVLNFNGDEYVPKSAVNDIIATAAKQGAQGGYAKTMGNLRNSRSARSRIGLG